MSLRDRFNAVQSGEYIKFERVQNKRSQRPDLHAFILLDELAPGNSDIVAGAGHDEIWLGVDVSVLEQVITDDQILELVRCGVRWDSDSDGLAMFA